MPVPDGLVTRWKFSGCFCIYETNSSTRPYSGRSKELVEVHQCNCPKHNWSIPDTQTFANCLHNAVLHQLQLGPNHKNQFASRENFKSAAYQARGIADFKIYDEDFEKYFRLFKAGPMK